MRRRNDDQFLLIPEPAVPWRSVRLAEFDAAMMARKATFRQERDMFRDTYEIRFEVSGQMIAMLARHPNVKEHLIEEFMGTIRQGLLALAAR